MKIIAISQRVDVVPARNERRDALDQNWIRFLHACGYLALPVPNIPEQIEDFWRAADFAGVVLTGGNDLAKYGGNAPERDDAEQRLIELARTAGKPILGVCRGMQVIQDLFHIPLEPVDGHVTRQHKVLLGETQVQTNSYHCWAARTTTADLDVWARAEDGVIEGIRHRRERILGFMWHPERYPVFRDSDVRTVAEFMDGK